MLNPNMNYPYPVIRVSEEDYRSTVFKGGSGGKSATGRLPCTSCL